MEATRTAILERKKVIPIERKLAYAKLRAAIDAKAKELKEIPREGGRHLRHKICRDLKWDLRIRYIENLTSEYLPEALDYIKQWNPSGVIKKTAHDTQLS